MKTRLIFHGIAILLLLATVAAAQSPAKPAKPAHATDRESSTPSVSEVTTANAQTTDRRSGSVIVADREASSGMATGRRQYQPLTVATDKSLGSPHATESIAATTQADKAKGGAMQNVSSNPMYKGNGDSKAAPTAGSHETVEYKDPEDMTTRYRPGNNKTTKIKPTSPNPPAK